MPDAKKKVKDKKESKSKISNTEWGIAIGALLVVDLLEVGLDVLFGIGAFSNPFIDFFVNLLWPTYLYLRGVNLKSVKMLATLLTGGGLQLIPVFDGFWAIEGLIVMLITKAEKKIREETGVDVERITTATKSGMVGSGATATERAASAGAEASEIGETAGEAFGNEEGGEEGVGRFGADEFGEDEIGEGAMDAWAEGSRESAESDTGENAGEKKDGEDKLGKASENKNRGRNWNRGTERRQSGGFPNQNRFGEETASPNRLDLRQPKSREEGFGGQERPDSFHSNLLDLANSYRGGERKDDFEKENEKSFPE